MDYDTYSANDAIGKVNICLNPLLLPSFDMTGQVIRTGKGIFDNSIRHLIHC